MDEEKIDIGSLGDVYDDHNLPNLDRSIYDDSPIMEEMKVTGSMKMLFIVCGIVGVLYSLYQYGFFQAAVWIVAIAFILDMMGVFDKMNAFLKDLRKPRGGYENIDK